MSPALETPRDVPETNNLSHPPTAILDPTTTPATTTATARWTPQTALAALPAHERPLHVRTTTKTASPFQTSSTIPFLHLLTRLKTTKREGWRRFGITHGESIADHMYRMSLITMIAPRSVTSRLDMNRCTRMALVHDMAELLVGDITPLDKMDKAEKSRRESETIDWLCGDLLGRVEEGVQGEELRALWREYEDGKSEESRFVHDVDKIELVLQIVEYEKAGKGQVDLGEFAWVAGRVILPECRAWVKELLMERDVFWEGVGKEPENGKNSQHRLDLQALWDEDGKLVDGGNIAVDSQ